MACERQSAPKAQYRIYSDVIQKAAKYAKENNKFVGIYRAPEAPGGFAFTLPAPGAPHLEIVSQNN